MSRSSDRPGLLVPEEYTHLYHTPWYEQLKQAQRLHYNTLYGLRINEQFIQFEELFIKGLMPSLKRHKAVKDNSRLLDAIGLVLQDEERHSRMFARYNRAIRPDLYRHNPTPFTRLRPFEQRLLKILLATPGLLPAMLWLLLAMEEMTTAISHALITHPHADRLDKGFIDLHRLHMLDEQRHVGIDMKLILSLQEYTPVIRQKINAGLFRNVFNNILQPRRSTILVIRQLVREEPELHPSTQQMIRAITALDLQSAFPANLVSADRLPVLHSLFDRFPDFRLKHPGLTSAL